MSLRIWADETKPVPRPVFLGLVCDRPHGLFPVELILEGGYIAMHAKATAAGWSITSDRVLCPDCAR